MCPHEVALVLEDKQPSAEALRKQLEGHSVPTRVFASERDLLACLGREKEALVSVDIDMGHGRRRAGIDVIRRAKELERAGGRSYWVAALTSHADLEREANEAGADAFIRKESPITDALELLTKFHAHRAGVEERAGADLQDMLARREYRELMRQVKALGQADATLASILIALEKVGRALDWPFLNNNEQMILGTLERQLNACRESYVSPAIAGLCLEGVQMLEDRRAQFCDVGTWLSRLSEFNDSLLMEWYGDE